MLIIKSSAISGQGTFAKQFIAKGSHVTTLIGDPFPKEEIDIVCQARQLTNTDPLQIEENTMLALDFASKAINHSCAPNTGIRHQSDLYAIRDIHVGDEITYDYSTTVGADDIHWIMPCLCGHPNCRQEIRNVKSIAPTVLKQYAELDALPAFIRQALAL